jgi:hypothetical protein
MEYMRSNIVFGLFWLNLLVFVLNIVFYVEGNRHAYNNYDSNIDYNLRGLIVKIQNYFLGNISDTPKNLRILSDVIDPIILYLNLFSILFLIILPISFWVTKNECCSPDKNINSDFPIGSCCGACMCCNNCTLDDGVDFGSLFKFDWNSTGYGDGNCFGECCGMILFFIIKMIFVLIIVIFAIILIRCGKNLVRMVSFIALTLIEIAIIVMSIISCSGTFMILITAISSISAFCNLLGILLPNLGCFSNLSYVDYPETKNISSDVLNSSPESFVPPSIPNNSNDIPPYPNEQEINCYYNETNQGYNSTSGNAYDAPPIGYQQYNYYEKNNSSPTN